jgi:Cys-tRNA synthase (O-phospho-L-seryl-tRNA:Cys-tRNA synthase)
MSWYKLKREKKRKCQEKKNTKDIPKFQLQHYKKDIDKINQTILKTIINNERSKSYLLYKDLKTRVVIINDFL